MLGGDIRRLELAYSLMMTLPGAAVVRYGDEIGMGDDLTLPERNCPRTPMQLSTERIGGFTLSDTPAVPVISHATYGFSHVNVAMQRRDPDSFLNWTERIIRMRKESWKSVLAVKPWCSQAPARSWRCATIGATAVLFLHNLASTRVEVSFTIAQRAQSLINMLSGNHSQADAAGTHTVSMEPYGYCWYRVGGMDYLLRMADL